MALAGRSRSAQLLLVLALPALARAAPPCFEELRDLIVTSAANASLFNVSTRVNNPWFESRPAPFAVLPRGGASLERDVARALSCAAAHGLQVAVKAGGHGFGGYSAVGAGGAFVVSFQQAARVEDAQWAGQPALRVQAGARWGDVYAHLDGTALVAVGGLCPSVGVAGYVLGGGIGPRGRVHGLASDSVLAFTLVTANGSRVVAVDAAHHSDLFWALRGGGGGNFGVVTSITLRLHPAPPAFTWSLLCYPPPAAGAVLAAVAALVAAGLPRELSVDVVAGSDGVCAWVVAGTDAAASNSSLAPLLALAPTATTSHVVQYAAFGPMLADYAVAHGYGPFSDEAYRSKNCLVSTATVAARGAALAAATARLLAAAPAACSQHWIQFGGAVADAAPNSSAFPWRASEYMAYVVCAFNDSATFTRADAYLHDWLAAMLPFCDDGATYINFIDSSQVNDGWGALYYGANLPRLLRIKQVWAPPGATPLRFAQEIGAQPATGWG